MPIEWRPWWVQSLPEKFPNACLEISVSALILIFRDKTLDIREWNEDIRSYLLSKLASVCNKHMVSTIKCPRGYSEFQHETGNLPLDVVFQRYLPKCLETMTSRNQREDMFVVSAREDCIDDTLDNACWLLNPKWKVRPSIAFIEGQGPCVLTCKAHDG